MQNTLFISDLDGTLLNSDGKFSSYTKETIHDFVEQGGLFSIATGRTLESAQKYIEQIDLRLPVVLSNGVSVYDPIEKQYLSIAHFTDQALSSLLNILEEEGKRGFFYRMVDHKTHVGHFPAGNHAEETYLNIISRIYPETLFEIDDPATFLENGIPHFCVLYGRREDLTDIANRLDHTPGLQTVLYLDVYSEYYMLDVFSADASKLSGMQTVQKISRASRTVSFGDNHNDLPMLEGANESYAMEGAVPDAKALATHTIGSNDKDAVAKVLAEKMQRSDE